MHLVAVWSPRAEIAVPLPDRRSWTVDDRTPFEVVATHAATASRLVVAVLRTDENVGRAQCEALARERHVVGLMPASVVEDEVVALQGFDTRVVVGVDPSSAPGEPLLGRVVAFGGARRKCFVFDFVTRVAAAADEPALSSRLAFVRTRILPGVNLDEATRGPGPARTPGASP